MTPDAIHYAPRSENIRALVAATGLTRAVLSRRLGVSVRCINSWLDDGPNGRVCPYTAQYCLEVLVEQAKDAQRFSARQEAMQAVWEHADRLRAERRSA